MRTDRDQDVDAFATEQVERRGESHSAEHVVRPIVGAKDLLRRAFARDGRENLGATALLDFHVGDATDVVLLHQEPARIGIGVAHLFRAKPYGSIFISPLTCTGGLTWESVSDSLGLTTCLGTVVRVQGNGIVARPGCRKKDALFDIPQQRAIWKVVRFRSFIPLYMHKGPAITLHDDHSCNVTDTGRRSAAV